MRELLQIDFYDLIRFRTISSSIWVIYRVYIGLIGKMVDRIETIIEGHLALQISSDFFNTVYLIALEKGPAQAIQRFESKRRR